MPHTSKEALSKRIALEVLAINLLPMILSIITIILGIVAYTSEYYYLFMFAALVLSIFTNFISYLNLNQSALHIKNRIEQISGIVSIEDKEEVILRSSLVRSQVAKSFATTIIIFGLLVAHTYGVTSFVPFFILAMVYSRQWGKIEDLRLDRYSTYLKDANTK